MGKKDVGGKKKVDDQSRLIYLLVAFGLVTLFVVMGCFGCSNETPRFGNELDAMLQLQKLAGTNWEVDPGQVSTGLCYAKVSFGTGPDGDMNLSAMVYEDGNPVGEGAVMHGNLHGLKMQLGSGSELSASYSVSTDGMTETLTLTDSSRQKMFFVKK